MLNFDLNKITLTDVVAWWGAVVATAVLVWDVIKWKMSGRPKLDISVSADMTLMHKQIDEPNEKVLVVSVTNNGDKKTTLLNLSFWHYEKKPTRFRKQKPKILVAMNSLRGPQLPLVLEPGESWSGLYRQTKDIEDMLKSGFLFVRVEDSSKQKTAQARFVRSEDPKALKGTANKPG